MTTFFLRFMSAAAVATVLAGCATVPGDSYYEPAYHPVYGEPPVYIYPQPYIVRPYPAPPPPAYYGRPGYDRHWDDRRPAPPGHWRRPDRDNARDPHRDRDPDRPSPPRPNRPDRREPDREPQGGEPSRKPTPQGPDRVWRDARPPAQGQSAEDGRGPGGRLSMPGARP